MTAAVPDPRPADIQPLLDEIKRKANVTNGWTPRGSLGRTKNEWEADARELADHSLTLLTLLLVALDENEQLREVEAAARELNAALSEEHSNFDAEGIYDRYIRYRGEERLMAALAAVSLTEPEEKP